MRLSIIEPAATCLTIAAKPLALAFASSARYSEITGVSQLQLQQGATTLYARAYAAQTLERQPVLAPDLELDRFAQVGGGPMAGGQLSRSRGSASSISAVVLR